MNPVKSHGYQTIFQQASPKKSRLGPPSNDNTQNSSTNSMEFQLQFNGQSIKVQKKNQTVFQEANHKTLPKLDHITMTNP